MHKNGLLAAVLLPMFPLAAQSWMVDSQLDRLYSLDLATGAVTTIGSTLNNGLDSPADLCWRDDTAQLFTVDLAGGEVGWFDTNNGLFISLWNTATSGFQALAWDAQARRFWLHNQSNILYSLDPANGALTSVGPTAPANLIVTSLEVDAAGRLWALDATGAILAMDKTNGSATQVATTLAGMQGLAIDRDGVWFAVNSTTDALYRIDPETGIATSIGPTTGSVLAKGLAIGRTSVQRAGTACADGAGAVRRLAWTGDSNLGGTVQMGIDAGPVPLSSLLMLGFSASQAGTFALPLDLTPLGAPGCRLYTSADAITGPVPTGATWAVVIPTLPALVGALVFTQGVVLDPSSQANAIGMAFSDLARIVVRS